MKRSLWWITLAALAFAPANAWAQRRTVGGSYDRRWHLQTFAHVGVTQGRLTGFSYGATARLFAPTGNGVMLRVERVLLAGEPFRTGCDACRRAQFTLFDLAYAHRWILSRGGSHQWIASLYEGVSIGPRQMDDGVQSRASRIEAGPIDAGGVFGASVDLRARSFLVGFDLDVRLLATFGHAATTDDTIVSLRLRIGGDFSIRDSRGSQVPR